MYSFVSTNDFGHKTAYVSTIVQGCDCLSNEYFPLDPIYLFDDLFERFRSEIEHAHSTGTYFESSSLCVGSVLSDGNLQSSKLWLRLNVSSGSGEIRVYYATGSSPNFRYYKSCTKADYENNTRYSTIGKIYLLQTAYADETRGLPAPTIAPRRRCAICLGFVIQYLGTWRDPTSAHPYGQMLYNEASDPDARYTLPSLLAVGTAEQVGVVDNTEFLKMQPEIGVANLVDTEPWSGGTVEGWCSTTGEIDPDPDPPTPPGPGPTPSSDPNYDPNIEPGDNPNPSPGPHNRTYDPVPIPGLPTVTSVGAGFTTLYRPSEAILRLLASELYSDNAIQIISNFFSDPYDMIAGLSIVPFTVPVSGRAKHRIGLFESDIAMDVVSNQFVTVNCGDILIEPYYNSFLDHSPYTRLILWLPYIGYQEIDPDEIMGQMLNITYHCDCLSGACTAFVNTGVVGETGPQIPRVIAQFSGNCSVQIPTAAASYDNLIASSINILTTAVNAGVGQVSAAASMATMQSDSYTQEDLDAVHAKSAVSGGQSLIGCAGDVVRAMKPTVTRNGTPGSSAGYMGVQKPYLIKIVPRNSIPDDNAFMAIKGYPSNKTGTLSEYSGFCAVEDIQLNNVPATIGEINEIYDLLKGGVIL